MSVNYRAKVVALALSQVGTEGGKASGDDKYIQYYNSIVPSAKFDVSTTPWCAIFATYILRKAGVPTSACPNFASCTSMRNTYLKPKGIWKTRANYTPQAGDLIMFDWDLSGNCDHVGLVIKADSSKVYTVEGNTKGGYTTYGVRYKSYALTSKYIAGYGAIPYESIAGNISITVTTTPSTTTSGYADKIKKFQTWMNTNYSARLTVDGVYGPASKKAAIKTLQKILNAEYGCKLIVDGSFGTLTKKAVKTIRKNNKNNLVYVAQGMLYGRGYEAYGFDGSFGGGMETAIKEFQSAKNLTKDGIVGSNTWYRLANG